MKKTRRVELAGASLAFPGAFVTVATLWPLITALAALGALGVGIFVWVSR